MQEMPIWCADPFVRKGRCQIVGLRAFERQVLNPVVRGRLFDQLKQHLDACLVGGILQLLDHILRICTFHGDRRHLTALQHDELR